MSSTSLKRKEKENLPVNPNKMQIKYICMRITNMKKYNRGSGKFWFQVFAFFVHLQPFKLFKLFIHIYQWRSVVCKLGYGTPTAFFLPMLITVFYCRKVLFNK